MFKVLLYSVTMGLFLHIQDQIDKKFENFNDYKTLYNFCIQYPNEVFFGVLEPIFTCQQENA